MEPLSQDTSVANKWSIERPRKAQKCTLPWANQHSDGNHSFRKILHKFFLFSALRLHFSHESTKDSITLMKEKTMITVCK